MPQQPQGNWLDRITSNPLFLMGAGVLGAPNIGQGIMQGVTASNQMRQQEIGNRREQELFPLQKQLLEAQVSKAGMPQTTELQRNFDAARTAGFPGNIMEYQIELKRAGRPETNIDMKAETEGAKILAKRFGERTEQADVSRKLVADLDALTEIGDRIGTVGVAGNIKQMLGPIANAVGVQIDGLDDIQAFSSIVSRVAPQMRPPGSGATSDFEFKQFLNALPQLSQTNEGRKIIAQQMRALSEYNIAVGNISEMALAGELDRKTARQQIDDLGNPMKFFKDQQKALGTGAAQAPPSAGGFRIIGRE
jgi:hypothetical protein